MDKQVENKESLAYIFWIANSFIQRYLPKLENSFQATWEIFEEWINQLKNHNSINNALKALIIHSQGGLGFAEEGRDKESNIIVVTVAKVAYGTSWRELSIADLRACITKIANKSEAQKDLLKALKDYLPGIFLEARKLDRKKTKEKAQNFTKPFIVWENGKPPRDASQAEIEKLRKAALRNKYHIYADDVNGELLVFGIQSKLKAGETYAWITLTALLEKIGSRWTRKELAERTRPNINENTKETLSFVYQDVRYIKEVLYCDIDSLIQNEDPNLVNTWFDTSQRNRVNISQQLRACLIRKNDTQ
jgi:hypothetical protein